MKELAIIGTTASGKTALALELACKFNGIILSLDSLCIYKEINIASAKPLQSELQLVPHFGVNLLFANEHFDVGMFFEIYKDAKKFALENDKNLFIVGGSGFYLKALLCGLAPKIDKALNYPGNDEIYQIILSKDEKTAQKLNSGDTYRLQKWLDIYLFLQKNAIFQTPSEFLRENTLEPIISNLAIFDIVFDKEILRRRIANRTEKMLQNGLLEEAKELFGKYDYELKPLKSIGLKECGEFLRGEIKTSSQLNELICTHTAQLAKRQRTFNRSQFKDKFSGSVEECEAKITEFLKG